MVATVQRSDDRAAVEGLPHLAEKLCSLWNSRDLDSFVDALLLDSREGQRQGLPPEVAQEMVFIAQINARVRAMDSAARLQLSEAEAAAIMAGEGGRPGRPADPWSDREWSGEAGHPRRSPAPLQNHGRPVPLRRPAALVLPSREPAKPASTARYLSLFLNEAPPLPATVRVDLTTQETARSLRFPDAAEEAMSWEFFRCIAAEIGKLGAEELVLSHLGAPGRCPWVGEAVRFARQQARLPQVSLRVDPLTACSDQVVDALAGGLDCLVVDLNLACKHWRCQAETKNAVNPGHFAAWLGHLVQKRDEAHGRSQRRCVIKLVQTGKTLPHHALTPEIAKLAKMADNFSVEWLPDAHDLQAAGSCDGGGCLCWGPFVEANVRANGHLVVCSHDTVGSSFVADLKETEFVEAWNSQPFRHTRRELLAGARRGGLCRACPRALA